MNYRREKEKQKEIQVKNTHTWYGSRNVFTLMWLFHEGSVSRDGFCFGRHVWLVLGLNRGRGQFLNFLAAQMIL